MSDTKNAVPKFKFTKVKAVTMEQLKPAIDKEFYVKITSEMRTSDVPPKEGEKPAIVAEVVDLESGEEKILIIGAVVMGAFNDGYDDHSYVGKCFAITKGAKSGSKKFNPYKVTEITPE